MVHEIHPEQYCSHFPTDQAPDCLAQRSLLERDAALAKRDAAYATTLHRVLGLASSDTCLRVNLNCRPLWLPRDTLLTMIHCAHWEPDGGLLLWVENAHLTWMMERLAASGTFLDVGASTGATTLPIAVKGSETIVPYEPATVARELLAATLTRNGIGGVTIRPVTVSDALDDIEFREYLPDATGDTPWPIMSAAQHRTYHVPVVTLDGDALLVGLWPRTSPTKAWSRLAAPRGGRHHQNGGRLQIRTVSAISSANVVQLTRLDQRIGNRQYLDPDLQAQPR